ncbi:MAG: hypothetical protein Q4P29_04695 [Tissierellia bacterium]|nr:hypothetical protein [Tissierellia bacterium]
MKTKDRPIDVLAYKIFDEPYPRPVKFRIMDEQLQPKTVIIYKYEGAKFDKRAGNKMIFYKCQAVINDLLRPIELKYEIDSMNWYLFKV